MASSANSSTGWSACRSRSGPAKRKSGPAARLLTVSAITTTLLTGCAAMGDLTGAANSCPEPVYPPDELVDEWEERADAGDTAVADWLVDYARLTAELEECHR